MKLSLIFELLLIFVLLAFAASKNINQHRNNKKGIQKQIIDDIKIEDNSINKYCKCSESFCNCCRNFSVPVVNLNGPGCASLRYISGDKMSVSLSFGKKVITNRTLSSRKPSPVCMPLPGGISKFCGRVYNIGRLGEEFRACLGLELQAKSAVEAAVRVSCFKFGPRGVTSEPADPLPLVPQDEKVSDDDDDDEDEEDYGLGADDDDDEEEDDDDDDDGGLGGVNAVESADYTGFSILGEDILGDFFGSTGGKKPHKSLNKKIPTTTTTTTRRPKTKRPNKHHGLKTTTPKIKHTPTRVRPVTRKPVRKGTRKPTTQSTATTEVSTVPVIISAASSINSANIKPEVTVPNPVPQVVESHVMSVIPITDKPASVVLSTTSKSDTTFHDHGLEMSLAHITGQLSLIPVTQLMPTQVKESPEKSSQLDEINYEKLDTITPKPHSLIPFATPVEDNDSEMVQIVSSLNSQSEEHEADAENVADETRSHKNHNGQIQDEDSSNNNEDSLNNNEDSLPKRQKKGGQFNLDDLDVLDLTGIGESVGHQLGIFGRHKRQNKNKVPRPQNAQASSDYDDVFGLETLSDTMDLPDIDDIARKDRRRRNKMMRGLW